MPDSDAPNGNDNRQSSSDLAPVAASLARIAHELRTPLTTLRLALQLGRGRIQRGGSVELSTVERALTQVDQMTSLISQLTDAAQLVTGKEAPALQRFDLSELLRQGTLRATELHPSRPISVDAGRAVHVRADRRGLEQVISNILDNACKFSKPDLPIHIRIEILGGDAVVSIADQGIGIPEASLERIFEIFYRAPNAANASTQGLGLGLFIARTIVTKHGGRIWVESNVDRGSTFCVAFPTCHAD